MPSTSETNRSSYLYLGLAGETGSGRVSFQVPIGRVHGLPDPIQIGMSIRPVGCFVGLRLANRGDHGTQGHCHHPALTAISH